MLVDYLRYVAFNGWLRRFFEEAVYEYVEPSVTTGQHLRFAPDFLANGNGWRWQALLRDLHREPHSKDLMFGWLNDALGITRGPDDFAVPPFQIGNQPATFAYRENHRPKLEIIIDVDPAHWAERYAERRSYEDVPIIYRRASAARGNLGSGDKLIDGQRRSEHGTLCGIFCTTSGAGFALTCGHVVGDRSRMLIEQRRQIWKLPICSRFSVLGDVLCVAMCDTIENRSPVQTQLDAALIAVKSPVIEPAHRKMARQATIKPLSAILQEEPVRFRGAGRVADTLARVSAVTVRKSIDLFKDGKLRTVGDVLMLGHRYPQYIVQRVSRPGDSGAAVRQDSSSDRPSTELDQWYGMVLGSDEGGAFATYAEHLWAWAAQEIGDPEIEFFFQV